MGENESVQANPNAIERTPPQRKLAEAIMQRLLSEVSIIASYDPQKGRTGITGFVIVDSPDGKTHIVIKSDAPGEMIDKIGLQAFNSQALNRVEANWLDETTSFSESVIFIDRPDEHAYSSKFDALEPRECDSWKSTGGIDFITGGGAIKPKVSDVQLKKLAEQLENGHVNQEMTTAALNKLEKDWGAVRVSKVNSSAPLLLGKH